MKSIHYLLFLLPLALSACTSYDPVRVENDFGQSVRNMVDNQIYDPKAPNRTAAQSTGGLDGTQAELLLKKHREHVGNPSDIDTPIDVRINN